MNYCRDYYDANEVAQESYDALYTKQEPETRCDCGREAEKGEVYCTSCLDTGDTIMQNALQDLTLYNDWTEDEAEQFMCHWLENIEEFKERRNAKKL